MSTYKSNLRLVAGRTQRATDAGLRAAAQVIVNAVVRGLAGGYKSGKFVTGLNTASVVSTDPMTRFGERVILVGTSIKDPAYPLFWEVGFFSRWSRKFERKEVWGPALRDNADRAQAAFARAARRAVETGVGMPDQSEAAD
jgi:hypothetical protein